MSVRTVVATFLLAFAAASCVIPQAAESPTPAPLASALPLPSPSTSALGIGANVDPVVAVVQDLLPSVVTVINKLSNGQPQSSGSGFIVDASRGYIVTNNHVVENVRDAGPGAAFDVVFSDNRKVDAKLVGRDQLTDLAVLQVSAQNLKAAMLGDSDAPIWPIADISKPANVV